VWVEGRCIQKGVWWGGLTEGDPDVDGRIFRKWDRVWSESIWLRIVTGAKHLCNC